MSEGAEAEGVRELGREVAKADSEEQIAHNLWTPACSLNQTGGLSSARHLGCPILPRLFAIGEL